MPGPRESHIDRETTSGVNLRLIGFFFTLLVGVGYIAGFAGWSWYQRNYQVRRDGYRNVDLKRLTDFAMNQSDPRIESVPQHARDLDGQRVRLTGFMVRPENTRNGGRKFELVYNSNPGRSRGLPLVQERVMAYADKDIPIYDHVSFVEVAGTLHVRIVKDQDGAFTSVFDLDVDQAQAVP